jgi:hypothetical protein
VFIRVHHPVFIWPQKGAKTTKVNNLDPDDPALEWPRKGRVYFKKEYEYQRLNNE